MADETQYFWLECEICAHSFLLLCHSLLYDLHVRKCRINLARDLIIGKMFEINRIGRAFGVADAVAFTKNRINNGLAALRRLVKTDCIIGTGGNTGPAGYTIVFIYRADRS